MKRHYPRDAWYVAAWTHELAGDALISRTIINEPIVIYRRENGDLNALADRCVHRGLPLSMGAREGDDLRCGYHGFRFACSGICNDIPGKDTIPQGVRVRRYPVAARDSWIWVWMGDADAADESLIPASWSLDDPDLETRSGHVDYRAYYELVNDNLTDLSHLTYVHSQSFGAGAEWAKGSDRLEELDRGLRLQRWIIPAGGSVVNGGMAIETWQSYDYLVPGILLMTNSMFPPGTAARVGIDPPIDRRIMATYSWQAITPVTDATSRYFFAVAVQAGPNATPMVEGAMQRSRMAFEEDRITIEAQQRLLDLTGDQMMLAGHDAAPIKFRRLIAKMAR